MFYMLFFSPKLNHELNQELTQNGMSETVKVVCYKCKTLANGEKPLMIRICKDGKKRYVSLGISIKEELWNFKKNAPKSQCPNRERICLVINKKICEIQKALLDKKIEGKDFTATTLIEAATSKSRMKKTVGEYFLAYIANLEKEGRVRYAGMFKVSYSSFIKFNKHLDMAFSEVDAMWLRKYEVWAKEKELSVNTISTRLRHLRVIFNLAITDQVIKDDCYPFRAYKVSKLNKQTIKKAISKGDVLKVMQYQGCSAMERLAVDVFTFSYLTAGINFIDIAKLKRTNIIEGHVVYYRNKTKKLINVPLQPQAMAIIDKYKNEKSEYLFPILSSYHKTETQIANRLHKMLAKINKHLKEIGRTLNLTMPLTTYTARHSYATVLKRAGVSTSIISESLGHSSERVTQVYLDSFDNEQIDEAMSHLL